MRLLLLFILAWQVTVATAAPELKGQWKSNRELTLQTFTLPSDTPDSLRQRVAELFGNLELTYTQNSFVARMPAIGDSEASTDRSDYRVVMETKNKLMIHSINVATGESQEFTLNFVSPNRYWVAFPENDLPYMQNAKEYFDRIPESEG